MSPDEKAGSAEGPPTGLLQQAREKAVALLNRLLSEKIEAERKSQQGDWQDAMEGAIRSATRAVAAIEAAIKIAPGEPGGHRWN
jgi:hypothetical protein